MLKNFHCSQKQPLPLVRLLKLLSSFVCLSLWLYHSKIPLQLVVFCVPNVPAERLCILLPLLPTPGIILPLLSQKFDHKKLPRIPVTRVSPNKTHQPLIHPCQAILPSELWIFATPPELQFHTYYYFHVRHCMIS